MRWERGRPQRKKARRFRRAFDSVRHRDYANSKRPAAPMPPPMHMVTTPYFSFWPASLRRRASSRMWPVQRVPVMPKGWPMEIEPPRSEEHTSELQSLMRISYAVFCLIKKNIYITSRQAYVAQLTNYSL